jgi:hypothetical protein
MPPDRPCAFSSGLQAGDWLETTGYKNSQLERTFHYCQYCVYRSWCGIVA